MVTFRNNNNRRNNHRRNDRVFKSNVDRTKFNNSFNNETFQRKNAGRNNHNASKLVEKYNDLAREALSTGDKILSENYFQHADHFMRIINEKGNFKKFNKNNNDNEDKINDNEDKIKDKSLNDDQKIVNEDNQSDANVET